MQHSKGSNLGRGLQWLEVPSKVIVNIKRLIHPLGGGLQQVASRPGIKSKPMRGGHQSNWVRVPVK